MMQLMPQQSPTSQGGVKSSKDSTADGMNLTWELCNDKGESIAWSAAEQREMFDRIFERAFLMAWQKGDIALVDNIRIGHWRMNGEQGNRKLVQIQANAFNADLYQAQISPNRPLQREASLYFSPLAKAMSLVTVEKCFCRKHIRRIKV